MKQFDSTHLVNYLSHIDEKYILADFPGFSEITEAVRKSNSVKFFTGGVRINNSMYRTEEETSQYVRDSLAKNMP